MGAGERQAACEQQDGWGSSFLLFTAVGNGVAMRPPLHSPRPAATHLLVPVCARVYARAPSACLKI